MIHISCEKIALINSQNCKPSRENDVNLRRAQTACVQGTFWQQFFWGGGFQIAFALIFFVPCILSKNVSNLRNKYRRNFFLTTEKQKLHMSSFVSSCAKRSLSNSISSCNKEFWFGDQNCVSLQCVTIEFVSSMKNFTFFSNFGSV